MTALVAYYSRKGRTETVAHAVTEKLGVDLIQIKPPGRLNLAIGVREAMMGIKSAISPRRTDLTGIDTLIITTPVLAGKIPPFVSMYLSLVTKGKKRSSG
jgi:flavodoxin